MPLCTRHFVYSGTNTIQLPNSPLHYLSVSLSSSSPFTSLSSPSLSSYPPSASLPSTPVSSTFLSSDNHSQPHPPSLPSPTALQIVPSSFTPPPLNIACAYIHDYPIRVLFDESSQINIISQSLITSLSLPTQQLSHPVLIRGANSQLSTATSFVPYLNFRFTASTLHNTPFNLRFSCQPLITSSPFDLLLGISFIQQQNLVHHHCNHTIIYISLHGRHLTIALLHSKVKTPCRHIHCPFTAFTPISSSTTSSSSASVLPSSPIPLISSFTHLATSSSLIPSSTSFNSSIPSTSTLVHCTPTQFLRHLHHDTLVYCLVISNTYVSSINDIDISSTVRDFVLSNYPDLFPDKLPLHPPPSSRIEHSIDLIPNYTIPKRKLYRQSIDELAETKRQITEYILNGQITPSTSPFGSPILLVKKKDNTMRMCVDYHSLNDITVKNSFPLPRINDLHDQLAHAMYFTKLDLFTGYHQIPIKHSDQYKTAFISRYGTYEFKVMAFGLSNAPSTFQSAMHTLFHDILDDFVIVYLDDILIYSPSFESHQRHLDIVLSRLLYHQWYCKLKKCSFAQTSIEYLGHIISRGTL